MNLKNKVLMSFCVINCIFHHSMPQFMFPSVIGSAYKANIYSLKHHITKNNVNEYHASTLGGRAYGTPLMILFLGANSYSLSKTVTDCADYLFLMGAAPDGNPEKSDITPLTICIEDSIYAVSYLKSKGANINLPSKTGETPLMLAARLGGANNNMILSLLQNGAHVDLQDDKGNTALMYAVNCSPYYNFQEAYGTSCYRTLEAILTSFPNLALKNKQGQTAFDIIKNKKMPKNVYSTNSMFGFSQTVETRKYEKRGTKGITLLTNLMGNEWSQKTSTGSTLLVEAAQANNYLLVQIYVNKAIQEKQSHTYLNEKDKMGKSALYYAAQHNNIDMITYLLKCEAFINDAIIAVIKSHPVSSQFTSLNKQLSSLEKQIEGLQKEYSNDKASLVTMSKNSSFYTMAQQEIAKIQKKLKNLQVQQETINKKIGTLPQTSHSLLINYIKTIGPRLMKALVKKDTQEALFLLDQVAGIGQRTMNSLFPVKAIQPIHYMQLDGASPIFFAAQQNMLPVVQKLLSLKVNPNISGPGIDQALFTPLMWAIYNANYLAVVALVKAGAKVDSKDINGVNHLVSQYRNTNKYNKVANYLNSLKKK